jgi:hypothetical protein
MRLLEKVMLSEVLRLALLSATLSIVQLLLQGLHTVLPSTAFQLLPTLMQTHADLRA